MNWNDACAELTTLASANAAVDVNGVEYDSRRVQRGDVFVAMRGGNADGNRYIDAALTQGAVAIITDSRDAFDRVRREHPAVGAALVQHGRRALAEISASVMGHPERRLALSAVTGTNGKTTTAFLLESMLRSAGRTCVLIGTVETHVGDEVRGSPHTTPESRDVLEIFGDGVKAGATEAVMEMSSHALDQERVWRLPVDVAIFTNLTQDHLDYHGTMENYFAAKAKLFAGVGTPPPRIAVLNADDFHFADFSEAARDSRLMTYAVSNHVAEYRVEDVQILPEETRFRWVTPGGSVPIRSPLTGRVNVYNLLAASCAALARGLTMEEIAVAAEGLKQVPGRFQVVPAGETGITVVVDYAHTDDALRNLIALARELVRDRGGRVITLFGCGGDRDRTKRSKMGRAASEGSDLVVLTSDNPRSEDPDAIITEVLTGARETSTDCIVEADRAAAISRAIHSAKRGDIVLLAGKGHEKVQILREKTVPFDDVVVAAGVLKEMACG
ncbi:UDP-N-acetylmuramoyl-L-alanyl-D-glutamate--2,6-diaminopimelate ligase [Edaphobacter acidisoli]|uniref:UDP-N-acetylmuramoyl-L-alanyl-D-glutamate--2,6-diaminopimelate ligase n=1 Tax=Edaphobacter acidisoli TaxID=2040573 RepID=A0A916W4V9_9BACT|nr:UDP-N-acetylmuramoyl-L-alanyl-D-glutamate--2,6-diaminopimelate ligase [Edaphobacter acidisoli]GGA65705.1 UDP-N-acetylmuramoyl-L-alanyl-D-glutamate--2,6-diaminopimelate ligase [Edaphobacter acidisoli]